MKKVIIVTLFLLNSIHLFAQNTPSYPEPKEGYKRVDLIFPKIENSNQYKVEVQDLKVWNKLKGNNIVPGQRLIVSKDALPGKSSTHNPKYLSYQGEGSHHQGTGKL